MEKILDNISIINENERMIANILHDIKSPLYGIKIGLQTKLDTELNNDIFETIMNVLEYIEQFLTSYNFKSGKYENKIKPCDIRKIINKKIENFKYIFINKNIRINMILDDENFIVNQTEIFISSIIGNIISNIAFHASSGKNAEITMKRNNNSICLEFENLYNEKTQNFNLGLDFCERLTCLTKSEMTFCKTKDKVNVKLKIPDLKIK